MRHYVMIRSSYRDEETSARRLRLSRAVTIPSLAYQADRFEIILRVDPKDPLLRQRVASFKEAGVKVHVIATGSGDRSGEWAVPIDWRDDVLQTRLDDDDALAVEFVDRLREAASPGFTGVYTFPVGYVTDGHRAAPRRYPGNQFLTLQVARGGHTETVYDRTHNEQARLHRLRVMSPSPAWLWVRHPDAVSVVSGRRQPDLPDPIDERLRRTFAIDWAALGAVHSGG